MPKAPHAPTPDGTATVVRVGAPQRPLGAVVRVSGARATPAPFRWSTGRCVIGSSSSSDLVVSEATVSRSHVSLELVPEGVRVTDLGSHNGTLYLGQRVQEMVLAFGGRIKLGAAEVIIDVDDTSLSTGSVWPDDHFRGMVGASVAMRRLFATLARLEGTLVSVLIGGESGVGKELVARAIHEGSSIAEGPLVVVNCGAIPRDLAASELFGHRRGAFTGAVETHRGAFESADGGTLFLDEIGELPLEVQPMLLRVLETGDLRPVGGEQTRQVKVRVIAATHRDLKQEVASARFREDLYYRLAVVKLSVPPLRERPEDVEPLARRFAADVGLAELPVTVIEHLRGQSWPGNVRELRNAVHAYGAIGALPEGQGSPAAMLRVALERSIDLQRAFADQKEELNDLFTKMYLDALMAKTGQNQSLASRISGIDRTYLGRLLVKHGLSKG